MAKATAPTGVSLRPSNFSQGGGLIDDVDVEIVRARFGFGYGGQSSAEDATTLQITLKDSEGEEHHQYYGCGTGFVPSEVGDAEENGKMLVPVSDRQQPSGSSNMAIFVTALVNVGLDESLLDDGDISALEGTYGHVNRVPAPKRDGLPKREGRNADRPATILVFTELKDKPAASKPNGKVTAKPAGKAAPAKTAPAAAKPSASDELTEELTLELMGAFAAGEVESMKKIDIAKALFKTVDATNPNKKALIGLAAKDDVLASLEGFTFEKGVLTQDQ